MLVTALATTIGFFSNVNADAAETQITEDIVKSVTLSVYENGTQVTSNVYKLDSTVKLNLTYELPDAKYGEGSTYSYTLPSQLKIDQTYSGILVNSEFADGVGTYTVGSDNKVVFKFNKNIDGLFDIKGSFWVESKLSSTTVTGSTTQVLPFPIAGNASNSITLQIQPNNGKAVSKSGVPLPQKYNASTIEWTVDVNTSLSRLANASVTDTIPTGLDLNTVSIAVYGLNVDVQGNVTQGGQLDPALYDTSASTARNLNLKFNNTLNEAYRVKFSTSITDTSKSSFTNTATLNGNGASQSGTSSAVGVSYGKPLEKTAGSYNSTTETISWQIKFNYDEKTITADKAVLTDYFNISQDYVPASLKIFKVKLDQNGSGTDDGQLTAGTDYTVTTLPDTATTAGFKIQFNNDIQSAYRIVYDTKVADRVYSGESIVNKVTYNGQTVQASTSTTQRILNKQAPSGVNYLNKTVNWTIKVNEDNRTMTNLLLTDKFDNAGLKLTGKPVISPALVENVDYTITNLGSGDFSVNDGFQIKFLKPITEAYTITYSTEFDYYKLKTASSYFRNTASIVWDEKTTTGTQTSAQTFTPRTEVIKNGLKSGSYDATSKTITWKVGANYNKRALAAGAELVDTLPASQQMAGGDAGSVKVYDLTYTSNGNPVQGSLVNAAEYEASVTSDGRKLKVKFKNDIDYAFYVIFQTEFIAGDINLDKVTNTAILNDAQSNAVSETLTSPEVSVPNGGQYVTKTGTRDSSDQTIINWTMTINANQSVVGDAQVVDTPSTNQVLLPASFQLYKTTVNSSGAVTATSVKLAQGTDYTLEFLTDSSGKDIFKLTFKNTISEPYVLKYQTVITAVGTVAVTNAVSFTGTGSKSVSKPFSYSNSFTIVDTGGTGSGVKGSLKVLKTNADQSLILPGAEFSLGRIVGSELKETKYATSDSGGNLEFKDLRAGKYILKETKAPAGYAVDTTERTVTINSSTPVLLTVTNDFNGSLKVTKVAKENTATKLAGAVFELYNSANTLVGSGTTNASGELIFTKLMGGSYTLKETKAPDGYVITAGSTAVTIDPAQQKTLTVTNDKIVLGSLKLTKVDSANLAKKLAGAEFKLYDASSKALVATATTDANGVVEFKDLKLGAYTFKETVAPSGYVLDSAERSVNITSAVQIVQQITNNELLGSIKLTKVDGDNTAKKLAGAEFKLYNASDVVVATATTDANGVVEFKDLKLGTYTFKETAAPVGYVLNGTERSANLTLAAPNVQQQITNKEILGSLKLTKVDQDDTTKKLSGAEFKLYNASDVVVATATTDANGVVEFKDLKLGAYTFKETVSPVGYVLNSTERSANLTIAAPNVQQQITNKEILGSLKLTKVDQDDTTKKLSGAEFKLYDSSDAVVATATTDANGVVEFKDLKLGTYTFKETVAPVGYMLNGTERSANLTIAVPNVQQQITNKAIPATPAPTAAPTATATPAPATSNPGTPASTPTASTVPGAIVTPGPSATPTPGVTATPGLTTPGLTTPGPTASPATPAVSSAPTPQATTATTISDIPIDGEIPLGGIPSISEEPSHGTVVVTPDGTWTYTPDPGFTGKDKFTVTVTDEDGNEQEIIIEVDIDEVPLGSVPDNDTGTDNSTHSDNDINGLPGNLPKTGEESPLPLYLTGGGLMVLGIFLAVRFRTRNKQE
ncbi:hypothetical protein AWJ19_00825 [Paenibacillus sp. DMB5]|nr:hypothetical protein AWJ19_00825 [Paenibacillus sp. DMB5]